MESMTGYGESSWSLDGVTYIFRIKSLNSKNLEINMQLPKNFLWFEVIAENIIKKRFLRGKINLILEASGDLPVEPVINQSVIDDYIQLFKNFYNKKNIQIPMDILIRLPGIFIMHTKRWKGYESKFEFYFMRSVLKLERQRLSEGKKIYSWLKKRFRLLQKMNQRIESIEKRNETKKMKKVRDKTNELLKTQANISNNKVKIEIKNITAFAKYFWMESKSEILSFFHSDITEEIKRIDFHLGEIEKTISDDKAMGKKLDFYFVELLREVNTLTAKTHDLDINTTGIKMKVELEKIREQTRNIV